MRPSGSPTRTKRWPGSFGRRRAPCWWWPTRSIAGPRCRLAPSSIAGDAVVSIVRICGQDMRFVETAGLRPVVKTKGIEYYGLVRSLQAIDEAQVALLVVDGSEGVTGDDKRIAARVVEAGRGLVVVLN